MRDNSQYKEIHDNIVEYVKEQIGIDLNNYRDGDGTNPYTTTYWDVNGPKVCINWCGSRGGMDFNTQQQLERLAAMSHGKVVLEWGGAWFKYIYLN